MFLEVRDCKQLGFSYAGKRIPAIELTCTSCTPIVEVFPTLRDPSNSEEVLAAEGALSELFSGGGLQEEAVLEGLGRSQLCRAWQSPSCNGLRK